MLCLIVERYALLWPEDVSWYMKNPTPPPTGSVISIDDLLQSMKLRAAGEVCVDSKSSYYDSDNAKEDFCSHSVIYAH
jgi:hypothetical protein